MSVPAKRRTKSAKRRRASHFALERLLLVTCPKCKKKKWPHQVCQFCGFYRGKEIIDVKAKLDKRERKKKERQEAKEAKVQEKEAKKAGVVTEKTKTGEKDNKVVV